MSELIKNQLLIEKYEHPSYVNKTLGIYTYKNKYELYHRDGDRPAIISGNNSYWFKDGYLHRDGDLPAIIRLDSEFNDDFTLKPKLEFWKNGQIHRNNDEPALIWSDNKCAYFKNDRLHRIGKPAYIHKGVLDYYEEGIKLKTEYDYKTKLNSYILSKPIKTISVIFLINLLFYLIIMFIIF